MSFAEITITMPRLEAEVMIHIDKSRDILSAYTYRNDTKYLEPEWIGEPTQNPLFVDLTDSFISDNREEIEEWVSDAIAEDTDLQEFVN